MQNCLRVSFTALLPIDFLTDLPYFARLFATEAVQCLHPIKGPVQSVLC